MTKRIFTITDKIKIACKTGNTRQGFKHVATLYIDGKKRSTSTATYLNRTWERYEFQSVMKQLITKSKDLTDEEKEQIQEYLKGDHTNWSGIRMVGAISKMGDIFGKTLKEKNDWKLRMIKAGMEKRGLQIPEDWNTLSEEEKARKLKGIEDMLLEK